ncbi:MAG: hypothetical protein ABH824_06395 [Nanoarchaeota archaeon]
MEENIYKQVDLFYQFINEKIREGKYQFPLYVQKSGHLNFPRTIKSIHFKLSSPHYFNTQLIKIREQINDVILDKYGNDLEKKDNTTEYNIQVSISPTLAAIYFDSFILHLASFFDIYSKLIQHFYPNCKCRTINKLQESLNDNYPTTYMNRFVQKNWNNWIKLIYEHRVIIYHDFYDEPDHIYNIRIDTLNQIKTKYFNLPEQLKSNLTENAMNKDILSFTQERIRLLENFIGKSLEIIKMEILNLDTGIIRFGGDIMTEEKDLIKFGDGEVLKAEQLNKNFSLLIEKINKLEEKIAQLECKKTIE